MNLFTDSFIGLMWRPDINVFNGRKDVLQASYVPTLRAGLAIAVSKQWATFLTNYPEFAWCGVKRTAGRYRVGFGAQNKRWYNGTVGDFIWYTTYCLDLIYSTAAGKAVLDGILRSNRKVVVCPSAIGGNQYRVRSSIDGMIKVSSLLKQHFQGWRNEVLQIAKRTYKTNNNDTALQRLLAAVQKAPLYSLHGVAPADLQNYPGPNNDRVQLQTDQQSLTNNQVDQLSQQHFNVWFDSGSDKPLKAHLRTRVDGNLNKLKAHLWNSIISELYAKSYAGPGTDVLVDFAPGGVAYEPMTINRPQAIGLYHELVHAYHAVRGRQPDSSDTDVVLTEMLCVGLGPWANADYTENRLRSQWRPNGFNWIKKRVVSDEINLRKHQQARPYYAWDENATISARKQTRWHERSVKPLLCSLCGKKHTPGGSTALGRWHRCDACHKVYCNWCGKWKLKRGSYFERGRLCPQPCGGHTTLID